MRTGPSDRGSQYAAAQAATVSTHAAMRKGKRPASGNAPPRTARGARVAAASTSARAMAGWRCRALIATASHASSRNTPATGLPNGVATDSTRASPRWRRRAASAARPSGESERERQPADGQVDDGARREEQRRRSGSRSAPGRARCAAAGRSTPRRPRRWPLRPAGPGDRTEGRQEDAVAGGRVPAVPGRAPDREARPPEQLDAEQQVGHVGASPARTGGDCRQGSGDQGRSQRCRLQGGRERQHLTRVHPFGVLQPAPRVPDERPDEAGPRSRAPGTQAAVASAEASGERHASGTRGARCRRPCLRGDAATARGSRPPSWSS